MAKIPRGWDFHFDFIGRMNQILWVSVLLTIVSIGAVFVRGLNFGTDFAGGYEIQVQFPKATSETQVRDVLVPMGLDDARVQRFGSETENEYLIMVRGNVAAVSDETKKAVKSDFESLTGTAGKLTSWSFAESGESLSAGFPQAVTEAQVRDVLSKYHLQVKTVAHGDRVDRPEYTIQLLSLADQVANHLKTSLSIPLDTDILKRVDFVGPQVGAQLRNQGIMAVVYSLLLILAYVALRFDLFFSPGAVIATLHDVVITVGVFAIFQIEFNLTVVAAILTLIGYSLNDTIVVYDRIRENVVRLRGRELRALVNTSINETLSRTILTSSTVFMVVSALLIWGGAFIRGFSITMFVGVIVGTYSSIFVASPLYIVLRERAQKKGKGGTPIVAAA